MAVKPRFLLFFRPGRSLLKASGLYLALLAFGSAFADYSQWVSDLRDAIKAESWTVFYAYLAWLAAGLTIDGARAKVRYDLAILLHQRGLRRRPTKRRIGR